MINPSQQILLPWRSLVSFCCLLTILFCGGARLPTPSIDYAYGTRLSSPFTRTTSSDTRHSFSPLKSSSTQYTVLPQREAPYISNIAKRIQALFASVALKQFTCLFCDDTSSQPIRGYVTRSLNPTANLSVCFARTELLDAISHPPTFAL